MLTPVFYGVCHGSYETGAAAGELHLGPTFTWSVAANDSVNYDTLEASYVGLIGATARTETLKLARTRVVQAPLWSATASGALLNFLLGSVPIFYWARSGARRGKAPRLAPLRSTTASGALLNFLLGYGKAPRLAASVEARVIYDLRQQRARFAVILYAVYASWPQYETFRGCVVPTAIHRIGAAQVNACRFTYRHVWKVMAVWRGVFMQARSKKLCNLHWVV
ncbi:hypothetical protein HPB51_027252 [Rhipicephalus microplus]|uniref:Uncharacterized protein n=1 Tax=Rhipicephalus microplus TaxID=6941 RepID=A0A9J6D0N2_RHIMP|nr:hypothetical protein HPB51_027252 [Rhipicephalus microplus]